MVQGTCDPESLIVPVLRMCVASRAMVNCRIYTDGQDRRLTARSVRVTDRYGWTTLTATAMKTR